MATEQGLQAQVAYLQQELQLRHQENSTLKRMLQQLLLKQDVDWESVVHSLLTDIQVFSSHHMQSKAVTHAALHLFHST